MNLRQMQDTPNTRVLQVHEIGSLHITFDCLDSLVAPVGTPVKLGSDGKVAVAAATDAIIGIVYIKKNHQHNGQPRIGVLVNFKAQIKGVADGAVTCGTELTTTGVSASGEAVKYKTAASGDKVVGIALASAADMADVIVGCLVNTYKK